MRRRLVIVAVFLLAGAVVNVAVAWAVIAKPSWADMKTTWRPDVEAAWPVPVPEHWPPPQRVVEKRSRGVVVHEYVRSDVHVEDGLSRRSKLFILGVARSGLPLSSMRWHYRSVVIAERFTANRSDVDPSWSTGFPVASVFPASRQEAWKRLPTHPLWPGFAVNAACYAAILWLLIRGPFALRRRLRANRAP